MHAAAGMGIRRPLAELEEDAMADKWIIPAEEAADVVARLKRRMIDEALPLWSTVGWDDATGGFIDRLHRDGVASLFATGIDPMVVIRWKDIFESLEAAVDACETVAHVLEGIALKRRRG